MDTIFIGCWLGGAAVVAVGASAKGYSGLIFFVLSLFATPLVALVALCFAPTLASQAGPPQPRRADDPYKYCGRCTNKVVLSETVCLHCGADLAKVVRLPSTRVPSARPSTPALIAAPAPRLEAAGWRSVEP